MNPPKMRIALLILAMANTTALSMQKTPQASQREAEKTKERAAASKASRDEITRRRLVELSKTLKLRQDNPNQFSLERAEAVRRLASAEEELKKLLEEKDKAGLIQEQENEDRVKTAQETYNRAKQLLSAYPDPMATAVESVARAEEELKKLLEEKNRAGLIQGQENAGLIQGQENAARVKAAQETYDRAAAFLSEYPKGKKATEYEVEKHKELIETLEKQLEASSPKKNQQPGVPVKKDDPIVQTKGVADGAPARLGGMSQLMQEKSKSPHNPKSLIKEESKRADKPKSLMKKPREREPFPSKINPKTTAKKALVANKNAKVLSEKIKILEERLEMRERNEADYKKDHETARNNLRDVEQRLQKAEKEFGGKNFDENSSRAIDALYEDKARAEYAAFLFPESLSDHQQLIQRLTSQLNPKKSELPLSESKVELIQPEEVLNPPSNQESVPSVPNSRALRKKLPGVARTDAQEKPLPSLPVGTTQSAQGKPLDQLPVGTGVSSQGDPLNPRALPGRLPVMARTDAQGKALPSLPVGTGVSSQGDPLNPRALPGRLPVMARTDAQGKALPSLPVGTGVSSQGDPLNPRALPGRLPVMARTDAQGKALPSLPVGTTQSAQGNSLNPRALPRKLPGAARTDAQGKALPSLPVGTGVSSQGGSLGQLPGAAYTGSQGNPLGKGPSRLPEDNAKPLTDEERRRADEERRRANKERRQVFVQKQRENLNDINSLPGGVRIDFNQKQPEDEVLKYPKFGDRSKRVYNELSDTDKEQARRDAFNNLKPQQYDSDRFVYVSKEKEPKFSIKNPGSSLGFSGTSRNQNEMGDNLLPIKKKNAFLAPSQHPSQRPSQRPEKTSLKNLSEPDVVRKAGNNTTKLFESRKNASPPLLPKLIQNTISSNSPRDANRSAKNQTQSPIRINSSEVSPPLLNPSSFQIFSQIPHQDFPGAPHDMRFVNRGFPTSTAPGRPELDYSLRDPSTFFQLEEFWQKKQSTIRDSLVALRSSSVPSLSSLEEEKKSQFSAANQQWKIQNEQQINLIRTIITSTLYFKEIQINLLSAANSQNPNKNNPLSGETLNEMSDRIFQHASLTAAKLLENDEYINKILGFENDSSGGYIGALRRGELDPESFNFLQVQQKIHNEMKKAIDPLNTFFQSIPDEQAKSILNQEQSKEIDDKLSKLLWNNESDFIKKILMPDRDEDQLIGVLPEIEMRPDFSKKKTYSVVPAHPRYKEDSTSKFFDSQQGKTIDLGDDEEDEDIGIISDYEGSRRRSLASDVSGGIETDFLVGQQEEDKGEKAPENVAGENERLSQNEQQLDALSQIITHSRVLELMGNFLRNNIDSSNPLNTVIEVKLTDFFRQAIQEYNQEYGQNIANPKNTLYQYINRLSKGSIDTRLPAFQIMGDLIGQANNSLARTNQYLDQTLFEAEENPLNTDDIIAIGNEILRAIAEIRNLFNPTSLKNQKFTLPPEISLRSSSESSQSLINPMRLTQAIPFLNPIGISEPPFSQSAKKAFAEAEKQPAPIAQRASASSFAEEVKMGGFDKEESGEELQAIREEMVNEIGQTLRTYKALLYIEQLLDGRLDSSDPNTGINYGFAEALQIDDNQSINVSQLEPLFEELVDSIRMGTTLNALFQKYKTSIEKTLNSSLALKKWRELLDDLNSKMKSITAVLFHNEEPANAMSSADLINYIRESFDWYWPQLAAQSKGPWLQDREEAEYELYQAADKNSQAGETADKKQNREQVESIGEIIQATLFAKEVEQNLLSAANSENPNQKDLQSGETFNTMYSRISHHTSLNAGKLLENEEYINKLLGFENDSSGGYIGALRRGEIDPESEDFLRVKKMIFEGGGKQFEELSDFIERISNEKGGNILTVEESKSIARELWKLFFSTADAFRERILTMLPEDHAIELEPSFGRQQSFDQESANQLLVPSGAEEASPRMPLTSADGGKIDLGPFAQEEEVKRGSNAKEEKQPAPIAQRASEMPDVNLVDLWKTRGLDTFPTEEQAAERGIDISNLNDILDRMRSSRIIWNAQRRLEDLADETKEDLSPSEQKALGEQGIDIDEASARELATAVYPILLDIEKQKPMYDLFKERILGFKDDDIQDKENPITTDYGKFIASLMSGKIKTEGKTDNHTIIMNNLKKIEEKLEGSSALIKSAQAEDTNWDKDEFAKKIALATNIINVPLEELIEKLLKKIGGSQFLQQSSDLSLSPVYPNSSTLQRQDLKTQRFLQESLQGSLQESLQRALQESAPREIAEQPDFGIEKNQAENLFMANLFASVNGKLIPQRSLSFSGHPTSSREEAKSRTSGTGQLLNQEKPDLEVRAKYPDQDPEEFKSENREVIQFQEQEQNSSGANQRSHDGGDPVEAEQFTNQMSEVMTSALSDYHILQTLARILDTSPNESWDNQNIIKLRQDISESGVLSVDDLTGLIEKLSQITELPNEVVEAANKTIRIIFNTSNTQFVQGQWTNALDELAAEMYGIMSYSLSNPLEESQRAVLAKNIMQSSEKAYTDFLKKSTEIYNQHMQSSQEQISGEDNQSQVLEEEAKLEDDGVSQLQNQAEEIQRADGGIDGENQEEEGKSKIADASQVQDQEEETPSADGGIGGEDQEEETPSAGGRIGGEYQAEDQAEEDESKIGEEDQFQDPGQVPEEEAKSEIADARQFQVPEESKINIDPTEADELSSYTTKLDQLPGSRELIKKVNAFFRLSSITLSQDGSVSAEQDPELFKALGEDWKQEKISYAQLESLYQRALSLESNKKSFGKLDCLKDYLDSMQEEPEKYPETITKAITKLEKKLDGLYTEIKERKNQTFSQPIRSKFFNKALPGFCKAFKQESTRLKSSQRKE
jgi:hypothetical protein